VTALANVKILCIFPIRIFDCTIFRQTSALVAKKKEELGAEYVIMRLQPVKNQVEAEHGVQPKNQCKFEPEAKREINP
jgi:hypothetical protein